MTYLVCQAEGPTAREKAFKDMDKVLKPKDVAGQSDADQAAAQQKYDDYVEAARLAGEDAARRKDMRARLKEAKKQMYAWERELRSMYRYVFEYTAKLRGEINPATGELWTNAERTALAAKLYPQGCLHLAVGNVNHETLALLKHPAARKDEVRKDGSAKDAKYKWHPPMAGHVKYGSLVWEVLESWVRNPTCLAKFSYYIDNRMTYACESWMSKLRKFVPKRFHYPR